MYYLTFTAKRKNAKRHIVGKAATVQELKSKPYINNERYIINIYNGKWELIENIGGDK